MRPKNSKRLRICMLLFPLQKQWAAGNGRLLWQGVSVDRIIDGKRVDYWSSATIRHQRAEEHPATWGSWIRLA
jgi:hypothetical protein